MNIKQDEKSTFLEEADDHETILCHCHAADVNLRML